MPSRVQALISDVVDARERFITVVGPVSPEQATFRPAADVWSTTDNVEHLTLAERSGTSGIWKALDGVRRGAPVWSGEAVHRGRPIAEVIARTWREREEVPPIAAPSWGGPLGYWVAALRSGQPLLEALGRELEAADAVGIALDEVIYPHPISGPLDVWQRLEFLRFHLDRHAEQVRRLQGHPQFPALATGG